MKKKLKKVVAALTAAVMAVGIVGVNVGAAIAATETKSWSVSYVTITGAPSSATYGDIVTMRASGDTYTGTVKTMSDITNRKVTISSSTHTMSTGSIVFNNTGSRTWTITGTLDDVTYSISAHTDLSQATLSSTGTISR